MELESEGVVTSKRIFKVVVVIVLVLCLGVIAALYLGLGTL